MSEPWTSARFGLPLLASGQAAKETTHNEALIAVELLLHAAVSGTAIAPPPVPAAGECWIVAPDATGAWAGHDDCLAMWTTGGWRFAVPRIGVEVLDLSDGGRVAWTGSGWSPAMLGGGGVRVGGMQVVGARRPGIADPAAGPVVDAGARAAIAAILAALRGHGLIGPVP